MLIVAFDPNMHAHMLLMLLLYDGTHEKKYFDTSELYYIFWTFTIPNLLWTPLCFHKTKKKDISPKNEFTFERPHESN